MGVDSWATHFTYSSVFDVGCNRRDKESAMFLGPGMYLTEYLKGCSSCCWTKSAPNPMKLASAITLVCAYCSYQNNQVSQHLQVASLTHQMIVAVPDPTQMVLHSS